MIHGDWHELLPPEGPFDLLFFDGGHWKRGDVPAESTQALSLVAPGGIVLIDDLTPESMWPEEWRGQPDSVREFWLGHDDLVAVELMTTPKSSAILAVRRASYSTKKNCFHADHQSSARETIVRSSMISTPCWYRSFCGGPSTCTPP